MHRRINYFFLKKISIDVTVALSIKMSRCLAIITITEQDEAVIYGLPVFRDHYCTVCWLVRDYNNNEIIKYMTKYNIKLGNLIKNAQLEQI